MSVLDLTHTISSEMPVYPGTEKPVLTTACTIETAGYRETLLHMYSHTGTHMDAPAHMIARGRTLDSYGVEKFVGPGFVLDCRGRQQIPACASARARGGYPPRGVSALLHGLGQALGKRRLLRKLPLPDGGGRAVRRLAPAQGRRRGLDLPRPVRQCRFSQPHGAAGRGFCQHGKLNRYRRADRETLYVPDHAAEI